MSRPGNVNKNTDCEVSKSVCVETLATLIQYPVFSLVAVFTLTDIPATKPLI